MVQNTFPPSTRYTDPASLSSFWIASRQSWHICWLWGSLLEADCCFLMGAELFWEFFFFLSFFFFCFGWGWFWGCPGSFLGKPRGERQVRAGFRTFGGGFRAVQAPFWGNQWWNAGSIQVWTQKTANCPVHFCFLCVFIYVDVCVCVFVIEYVVCVFFLLLFWFFIQCTSFLVFAIYLFNL